MIIRRMRLRNFRGVERREVEFEVPGVTIIEGPNEVGKSSHIDALNLLLDRKAGSKHRDVLATQPVHRDAGPETEIEAQAGAYRFRYRKRWIKSPLTELEILEPTPENLAGDEAHDRVQIILHETTDPELWRALRIMQGDSMRAVDFSDTQALSNALDVSAGATPVGEEETALFQALAEEYGRYWTATGRENKELKEVEADVPRLEEELREADATLRAIEADAERLETLRREVEDTKAKGPDLENRVNDAEAAWEKARSAARAEEQARTELDLARQRRDQALGAKKHLDELSRKAAEAEENLQEHRKKVESAPNLTEAREELTKRQRDFDAAKKARKEAEAAERLRQADADDRHYSLDLEQMRERKETIDEARAQAEEARKIVATSQATDDNLADLRTSLDDLQAAEARLDAAAPHLRVERLGKSQVLVDGQALETEGAVVERRIESETLVEIADHARIAVTPGGDLHEMREAAEQHREEADRLLKTVAADDWASAVEANRKRAKAQQQVDEVSRIEKEKLRDVTYDSLVERIREVEARVEEYAKRRESELQMPEDFDEARELLETAQANAETARKAEEEAERPLEGARARFEELKKAHGELSTRTEVLEAQAETAAKNLKEAEQEHAEALNSLDELESNLQQKEKAWEATKKALSANDPESAKAKLDNAKDVFQGHDERLRQLERDLTQVKARIEVHEESGIFERCQGLRTELRVARRRAASMRRRADAARLAFEVLSEERDAARQAYVRPLQEAIERLGRILHGDSFRVKVGENLSVTHRTLNGRTLEFNQLSAGAKEQLGILTRAACAILVAKDGRIPLILDDTLGNTDPERLEAMGAVLNRAGRDSQVIILTCVPDRFRQVGGAKVVRLESAGS